MKIRPLEWRKPADDGADFGHEDSIWLADAIGGKFDICTTSLIKKTGGPGFLLWLALDPFVFEEHETEAGARASAEVHWQKSIRAVVGGRRRAPEGWSWWRGVAAVLVTAGIFAIFFLVADWADSFPAGSAEQSWLVASPFLLLGIVAVAIFWGMPLPTMDWRCPPPPVSPPASVGTPLFQSLREHPQHGAELTASWIATPWMLRVEIPSEMETAETYNRIAATARRLSPTPEIKQASCTMGGYRWVGFSTKEAMEGFLVLWPWRCRDGA